MSLKFDPFRQGPTRLSGVPEGFDALVLADVARLRAAKTAGAALIHVARDDQRLAALAAALRFFAPDLSLIEIPAWDCLPYDRVSPSAEIESRRLAGLSRLATMPEQAGGAALVVLTTVNAALQRVPPRQALRGALRRLAGGHSADISELADWLSRHGYERTATVRDPASFAVRGGILDVFPAGAEAPVRLDFFGDTVDSLRVFDAATQRSASQLAELELLPVGEAPLTADAIQRFRGGYRARFGAITDDDPIYEAVSEGRRAIGMEHWLPLFHEHLELLFDYAPDAAVSLDPLIEEARADRLEQIEDYYSARREAAELAELPYRALPPTELYLDEGAWQAALTGRSLFPISPFEEAAADDTVVSLGARQGHDFVAERADAQTNLFDAVVAHVSGLRQAGKQPVLSSWSAGSRERMIQMLDDHGLTDLRAVDGWEEARRLAAPAIAVVVVPLEHGFETGDLAIVSEQDILGERMVRRRRARRDADFLTEATSLGEGDLVVHVDHGIGRFTGLRTVTAAGAPHDCLEITYAGNDRLLLPVENIELLSRYGSEEAGAQLDRLGGAGWQARKSRLKERIREMAGELIKVAAARALRTAPVLEAPEGLFDEFNARFPFDETDDQDRAIQAVLEDLASGRPMDRLVCGDVGFGKTEVALRSAFVTAMAGKQVAVVVPTTLLARQHFRTFQERFRGLPIKLAQASRLVSSADLAATKAGLASGDIDIVIGTHALLGKSIRFRDLGLLIVDEEQHFGVAHKERLKKMRAEVHVLTLTATPIPRTLQLALSGVRELSLIATPPVDRLAVRTFITPFDPVTVREALLREHFRGGQSFYVCPRIADLDEATAFLRGHVPEVKFAVAHGQMAGGELEQVMTAFYDGKYDVLVSTNIVESGLDIPSANTLIVHRADMFGLAQLYQLRGRVGRSKTRAYALLTVPVRRRLTAGAEKRLKVLQSLDQLGAGFMLASHDLDIRGAGNLLGDEQSGHIKEVGFELYQHMLEEAVAELRDGDTAEVSQWSPQIAVGAAILIPETYVADLELRLGLYRRLSLFESDEELEGFAAELADRFGPLPGEVQQLLRVVRIKMLCRHAGIDRLDAGPKGALIGFRDDVFANPEGLIGFIAGEGNLAKLRPDHRLVLKRQWEEVEDRLKGVETLLRHIAGLARQAKAA